MFSEETPEQDALVAGGFGTVVGVILMTTEIPSLSLGIGSFMAFVMILLTNGEKRYAETGVLVFTLLGAVYYFRDVEAFSQTPMFAALSIGLLAGSILTLKQLGKFVAMTPARKAGIEDEVELMYNAGSSIASVVLLLLGYKVGSKALRWMRHTAVGSLGSLTFYLDIFGFELNIPLFWIAEGGLNMTLMTFAACLMLGWFTIDSLHHTWRLAKESAKAGVSGAKTAGAATAGAATTAGAAAQSAAGQARKRADGFRDGSEPPAGEQPVETESAQAMQNEMEQSREAQNTPENSRVHGANPAREYQPRDAAPNSSDEPERGQDRDPTEQANLVLDLAEYGRESGHPWGRVTEDYVVENTPLDKSDAAMILQEMANVGYLQEVAPGLYEFQKDPRS